MSRFNNATTGNYFSLGNATALAPSFPMTVFGWVNLANVTGTKRLIAYTNGAGTAGWGFAIVGDELRFTKSGVADVNSTTINLTASALLFIAASITSTNVRFLKIDADGVVTAQDVANASAFTGTPDTCHIGRYPANSTEYFNGNFGEVGVKIGTALTDAELVMISALGFRGVPDGPTGYWTFQDEGATVPDYSGNGNHAVEVGTMTSARHFTVGPMLSYGDISGFAFPIDAATVYLNLQTYVVEEFATVPFRMLPSADFQYDDARTVLLDLSVLGGECFSTAQIVAEGEAITRWAALESARFGPDNDFLVNPRFTATVQRSGVAC